jgi:hypothetical protein
MAHDSGGGKDAPTETKPCVAPSSLSLTPVLHARPSSSLCTTADFNSLFTACLDQATQSESACSVAEEYTASAMSCFSECMTTTFTPGTTTKASDAWGGVVIRADQAGLYFFNFGGCVAALDPSPAGQKCAEDFEAQLECQTLSCASCPVPTDPSTAQSTAYDTCEMAAPCSSYMTSGQTDCASNYGDAATGPAAACLQAAVTLGASTTTPEEATAAIRLVLAAICAPDALKESPDGGPDGGGDGG